MSRPDHPVVAVLATARTVGVVLKLCGDEVRVTAYAPDPILIEALRLHRPAIHILCRASSELGVRLSWSAAQLCIDDDPADSGYAAIHHFLRERLTQPQQGFGSLPASNIFAEWGNQTEGSRLKWSGPFLK
jgi:hypothetical protein